MKTDAVDGLDAGRRRAAQHAAQNRKIDLAGRAPQQRDRSVPGEAERRGGRRSRTAGCGAIGGYCYSVHRTARWRRGRNPGRSGWPAIASSQVGCLWQATRRRPRSESARRSRRRHERGSSVQQRVRRQRAAGRERTARAGRRRSGGEPSMGVSAPVTRRSSRGSERSRPTVYGCVGSVEERRRSAAARRSCPAYITAIRSAQAGDDAQVVGDDQDRPSRARSAAAAAAPGSGPGWSRRGRSSARRR